jgi:hypothetical protein
MSHSSLETTLELVLLLSPVHGWLKFERLDRVCALQLPLYPIFR